MGGPKVDIGGVEIQEIRILWRGSAGCVVVIGEGGRADGGENRGVNVGHVQGSVSWEGSGEGEVTAVNAIIDVRSTRINTCQHLFPGGGRLIFVRNVRRGHGPVACKGEEVQIDIDTSS